MQGSGAPVEPTGGDLVDPQVQGGDQLASSALVKLLQDALRGVLDERSLPGSQGGSVLGESSRGRRRVRDPLSDSASEQGEADQSPPAKAKRKAKGSVEHDPPERGFARLYDRSERVDDLSSSEEDLEEGELSGDDEDEAYVPHKFDRLCPPDLYYRVLAKSAAIMGLEVPPPPKVPNTPASRARSFPVAQSTAQVVPIPAALEGALAKEWEQVGHSRVPSRTIDKLYTLPEAVMSKLKVPLVDPPVVALSSKTTLPSEGEAGPKDPCDKRVDLALRRLFETNAQAFRASVAGSVFSRAAYIWAEELAEQEPGLSRKAKCTLKKIALAAAASSDATFDFLQLSSRSMSLDVLARRQLWLRNWQGDSASAARILGLPFAGGKLFGEALEPLLVDESEKKKFLPSDKKEPQRKPQSFRTPGPGFRQRGQSWFRGGQRNRRGGGNRSSFKPRKPGSGSSQAGKSTKDNQQ